MTFPWLTIGALGTAVIAGLIGRATRQWFLAAVVGSGVILFLHSTLYFHYTSDDAYISYRYARNLSDGLGLVWNPGEHVEGYTNFLWVVILAGFDKGGADIVTTGRWLGFSLAIVAIAGAYRVTRDLVPGDAGAVAGFIAALLLSASGPWAVWASGGLEGPLMATLVAAAVLLQFRERAAYEGRRWPPLSGVVWALVCMTRPDGLVLAAVAAAFKLIDGILAVRGDPRGARRGFLTESLHFLVWAGGFAIVYGPYFTWRYETYGWLMPNTYYAKVGSGLKQYDRGLRYSVLFLQEYGGWALLAVPAAAVFMSKGRAPLFLVLALVLAWAIQIAYVGGDSLVRFRLFVPVLPLFYAAAAGSLTTLAVAASSALPGRRRLAEFVVSGLTLAAMWLTLQPSVGGAGTGPFLRGEREAVDDRVAIGRWLHRNLPADTTIAVVPAGAIPYESRLNTIDMLGLSDEHIAHADVELGQFAAGHEKYDSEYVLDRRPDIIIVSGSLTPSPFTEEDYATLSGSALIPALPDMIKNERLDSGYVRRTVEVRGGRWMNLFVRKDASAVLVRTKPAPE